MLIAFPLTITDPMVIEHGRSMREGLGSVYSVQYSINAHLLNEFSKLVVLYTKPPRAIDSGLPGPERVNVV